MRKKLILLLSVIAFFGLSGPVAAQDDDTGGQVVDSISEGYYYIYSMSGTTARAMHINNTSFGWEPLVRSNARFIFRLIPTGEENLFYMQNLYEGSWWGEVVDFYESNFNQTEETRRPMVFAPQGDGTFKVRPNDWRSDKATQEAHETYDNFGIYDGGYNKSHKKNSGACVVWQCLGQWTGSKFLVEKVPDNELQTAMLKVKLKDALTVYTNANNYTASTDKIITNVDAEADPYSGEPSQFLTNCQEPSDKTSSFANLIDGDLSTTSRFQSTWQTSVHPKPQWIQVDVSADGNDKQIEGFKLELGLRAAIWGSVEQPSEVTVFATNDEAAAKDLDACTVEDVKANDQWTLIGNIQMPLDKSVYYTEVSNVMQWKPEKTLRMLPVESGFDNRYIQKDVLLNGGKYRYIRFYILNTLVNQSANHDFTFSEMQMYELKDITPSPVAQTEVAALLEQIKAGNEKVRTESATAADVSALEAAMLAVSSKSSAALQDLQSLIDSINSAGTGLTSGTTPGYNDSTKVAAYNAAYTAAVNGSHSALTDAEYTQLGNELRAALIAAQNAIVPVSDGYYHIVNTWTSFFTQMAMTGLPTKDILGWQKNDVNNPAQLFKITKIGEEQYSIQNVMTGKYIGTVPGNPVEVKVTDTQEVAQTITGINGSIGQFHIANVENDDPYHTEFDNGGENSRGYICTWGNRANPSSSWRFVKITGATLDSLLAVAPQENLKAVAAHEIDSARAAYDKTFNYKQSSFLITNADDTDPDNCQWWTTCQEPSANYSSYANLIDGNLGTCYQGTWQVSIHEKPQWIQADLKDHPVKDFSLYYGLRNGHWGSWEQITQITVFATNDESIAKDENIDTYEQTSATDGWKKMGVYDLPEELAIRSYTGSNRTFTYDINNVFDQKYRFIRFYATHTHRAYPSLTNDLGTFTIGELNLMENTYEENSAPYYYTTGLKDAADNLKAQEKVVADAITAGNITQEQVDRLVELRKLVVSLTPVKDNLQALYTADTTYVNKFAVGEEFGDVTDAEWTAMQTAISNAKAVLDADQPSANDIKAQETALTEAYNTFKAAQRQLEPNKWYYIVSRDLTQSGSIQVNGEGETAGKAHANNIYQTFTYGNCAYAPTDQSKALYGDYATHNINALKWGYYVAGEEVGGSGGSALYGDNLDPHTMWRFVPIEGKEGQYAIQNRANGLFMTSYTTASSLGLTADTIPYILGNLGSGSYRFRAAASSFNVEFAGDGYLYAWKAGVDNPNGDISYTLVPVQSDENILIEYPKANSIFIKSLPYAISEDIVSMNDGYTGFYGVKGLQVVGTDSTLLLEKKTSVQAGEPFIAICGDYTAYNAEDATTTFMILPEINDFSFEQKTVNGLTATLDYTKVQKPGLGYFADAVLKATAAGTGISGHSGYLDVKNMPLFTTTTEADVRIPLNGSGVDAIKGITTGNDRVVNVYSIDGKLIKKDVTGTKATKGLQKGLYIVGKKKVSVK